MPAFCDALHAGQCDRSATICHGQSGVLTVASKALRSLLLWFDNSAAAAEDAPATDHRIDWLRLIPFIAIHLGCLAVFWVGVSVPAVALAIALYGLRMFAITAFYHRYFSHRAFRTSRIAQFVFAIAGNSAAQRGPLWWSAHHRHHHKTSDTAEDLHSPVKHGFLRSHVLWFISRGAFATRIREVPDLARYPELRFLDRFDSLVPLGLLAALYVGGELTENIWPASGTGGAQWVVWGFCISTVFVYHATFCVNSLSHLIGYRRYETRDDSRNNWFIALITLGEGWHNNHHRFPGSARQGLHWYELDITWLGLRLLESFGIIWALKTAPLPSQSQQRKRR
jgi:stearoyl-CoA desaturase (Delta-9 desaturase)